MIEYRTGLKQGDGMPTASWVLMGLNESPRAPGWYSDINVAILMSNDYDMEKTEEMINEDLEERVNYMLEDPHYDS